MVSAETAGYGVYLDNDALLDLAKGREQAGLAAETAVSTKFMEAYFQRRAYDMTQAGGVLDLSSEVFFKLGSVVDWVHEHDLCHAAVAAAYGSVITLDKHWKRRVEALPAPHQLARTYYRPEIDQLIDALEALNSR